MARRQQGTTKPPAEIVRSVRFTEEAFAEITAAAQREAQPVTVFIRSAALREARRVLNLTPSQAVA